MKVKLKNRIEFIDRIVRNVLFYYLRVYLSPIIDIYIFNNIYKTFLFKKNKNLRVIDFILKLNIVLINYCKIIIIKKYFHAFMH